MQDSNLIVLTGAQATKINFSKIKGQIIASSVDFVVGNQQYTVKASKEVVLSAGALKTPQLLEVSGVGNAKLLSSLSIPSILDLPQVGENLQDHPLIAADFNVRPGFGTLDQMRFNSTFAAEAATEYATSRTGPMTYTFSFFAAVPLQSVVTAPKARSLLAELDAEIASTKLTPLQKVQYAYQRAAVAAGKVGTIGYSLVASGGLASAPGTNSSYLTLVAAAMQPFSRGSVHINSRNATLMPTIDVGYLKFGFDADIVTAGLKFMSTWTSTAPLSKMISSPNVPTSSQYQSDAALKEYVRDALIPFNHVAAAARVLTDVELGTTPMAPKQIGGVVDARLKVYGLQNVRIVDAGIFPMLVNAPLQPTVYAIAEKAADMIKVAWKLICKSYGRDWDEIDEVEAVALCLLRIQNNSAQIRPDSRGKIGCQKSRPTKEPTEAEVLHNLQFIEETIHGFSGRLIGGAISLGRIRSGEDVCGSGTTGITASRAWIPLRWRVHPAHIEVPRNGGRVKGVGESAARRRMLEMFEPPADDVPDIERPGREKQTVRIFQAGRRLDAGLAGRVPQSAWIYRHFASMKFTVTEGSSLP
ncbi:hypothetical protein FB451DRAFT_1376659 [Mycena latifolia]|nr:hypothetical protein FB451DRAFT_1376659 [Mycena latifolia]